MTLSPKEGLTMYRFLGSPCTRPHSTMRLPQSSKPVGCHSSRRSSLSGNVGKDPWRQINSSLYVRTKILIPYSIKTCLFIFRQVYVLLKNFFLGYRGSGYYLLMTDGFRTSFPSYPRGFNYQRTLMNTLELKQCSNVTT